MSGPLASETELWRQLVPAGAEVACMPIAAGHPLFPSEEAAMAGATRRRLAEFATGRACAREALLRLGHPACAMPPRLDGPPHWPEGITGSLAHSLVLAVAVLARASQLRAIGIDIQPVTPIPQALWPRLGSANERLPPGPRALLEGLRFACKEAAFKCWYQARAGGSVDLTQIGLSFDTDRFRAAFPSPDTPLIEGRWARSRRHWCAFASIALPSSSPVSLQRL